MKWLLRFLHLGSIRDAASVSGLRRPLGYQQLSLTGSSQSLTLPAVQPNIAMPIGYAVIQCIGGATTDFAVWRDDGPAPTATVGMQLFSGQELDYSGDVTMLKFILGSGVPVLNIAYYG
jgi:hypothetical protein